MRWACRAYLRPRVKTFSTCRACCTARTVFFRWISRAARPAGELSALFGAIALNRDKAVRVHGLQQVADSALEDMTPDMRARLDAYVQGVNAGLFESARETVRVSAVADTSLSRGQRSTVCWSRCRCSLNSTTRRRRWIANVGLMFETLPADVYDWLTTPGWQLGRAAGRPRE